MKERKGKVRQGVLPEQAETSLLWLPLPVTTLNPIGRLRFMKLCPSAEALVLKYRNHCALKRKGINWGCRWGIYQTKVSSQAWTKDSAVHSLSGFMFYVGGMMNISSLLIYLIYSQTYVCNLPFPHTQLHLRSDPLLVSVSPFWFSY